MALTSMIFLCLSNLLLQVASAESRLSGLQGTGDGASSLPPRSEDAPSFRDRYSIVLSCLATIFACTWTGIHPNIPSISNSRWHGYTRRIMTTVYALLAPETITSWALLQNFAAKKIARNYNKDFNLRDLNARQSVKGWLFDHPPPRPLLNEKVPWTETHGFFLQMGGFMLCQDGQPVQALVNYDGDDSLSLRRLIMEGKIAAPRTTEDEILDRSKGNFMSKLTVVLQTTWFVTQCVARWSSNLAVTELEIVTLGFAILNGITYFLWWNKPQNVNVPIFLELNPTTSGATSGLDTSSGGQAPLRRYESISQDTEYLGMYTFVGKTLPDDDDEDDEVYRLKLGKDLNISVDINGLWDLPRRVIQEIVRPLGNLDPGAVDTTFVKWGKLDVPRFFSQATPESETQFMLMVSSAGITSVLFGCVHLFPGWFLSYPSRTEMWLWQLSSVILTVVPIIICLSAVTTYKYGQDLVATIFTWLALMSLPLYAVSRITIIILALCSLRSLPESALQMVDWVALVPHIGAGSALR